MKFLPLAGVVLFACCTSGCRRHDPQPSPAAAANTDAAMPAAASQPAATETMLTVDGEPEPFTAVEARLMPRGSGLRVQLSTVAGVGPAGDNSLHFDLDFPDLNAVEELNGAEWHFVQSDEPLDDTLTAVELHQRSSRLDPVNVVAKLLLLDNRRFLVEVKGTFALFDPPEALKPVRNVSVTGQLEAQWKEPAAPEP